MVKLIGLIGYRYSGKSTFSKILKSLKFDVIDLDDLCYDVHDKEHKEVYKELHPIFGDDIFYPDNRVNKNKLGEIVFNDEQKLKVLEEVMFPRIKKRLEEYISDVSGYVVIEAPRLEEAGWRNKCYKVIVMMCDPYTQFKRGKQREGSSLSNEQILKRMTIQFPEKVTSCIYGRLYDKTETIENRLKWIGVDHLKALKPDYTVNNYIDTRIADLWDRAMEIKKDLNS